MNPEEETMADYWKKPTIAVSGEVLGDAVTILGKKYKIVVTLQ